MLDGDKEVRPIGRDEMNLAEFPITLIADRVPKGVKTVSFGGQHGTLTITGSDDYGLPTAPDADVIVCLIQLTKAKNNFTDPTVPFTRYELLKLLGWPDQGRQYRRLDESLRRWVGVTLRYDGAWWDASVKCRVDAHFHIIDSVVIFDEDVRRTLRDRGQALPPSSFTWSKTFFRSCQADNLKRLDLGVYFSLRSAVSRQLFRFLDKRFHIRSEWSFDLRELAFDRVGLSRNYTPAKIKEKLRPAIEELEAVQFIEPMPFSARYTGGRRRGDWKVKFTRKIAPIVEEPEPVAEPEPTGLAKELTDRGITRAVAVELVGAFPEDRIRAQIAAVDWLRAKRPKKIGDPAAYLVKAIREDYAPPAGYRAQVERVEVEQGATQAQATRVRERAEQDRIKAFWEGLSSAERSRIESEALATADPEERAALEKAGSPTMRRLLMVPVREAYIRGLLGLAPTG